MPSGFSSGPVLWDPVGATLRSRPSGGHGHFLGEGIDSVLASTFQDFEILVINDGSTDPATLETLRSLEGRDRVRVVHQENQGLAAARNKGAALGRGKYVIALDADDRVAPTYLEKCVWVLEHYP
ncbi:MAG TPA: glycosyltransferase family A protein, partial [Thermoanaerobaculia bacterium]